MGMIERMQLNTARSNIKNTVLSLERARQKGDTKKIAKLERKLASAYANLNFAETHLGQPLTEIPADVNIEIVSEVRRSLEAGEQHRSDPKAKTETHSAKAKSSLKEWAEHQAQKPATPTSKEYREARKAWRKGLPVYIATVKGGWFGATKPKIVMKTIADIEAAGWKLDRADAEQVQGFVSSISNHSGAQVQSTTLTFRRP
ncbi:hypothetical protein [Glycomyces arizonensis]|uniref:hypothetical protein n=1 Tax=Glycomyces arizonensis TaxID=256035 RepID=UPI0012EB7322|nr:hypothetical protein [Glycomyces arizonensis]